MTKAKDGEPVDVESRPPVRSSIDIHRALRGGIALILGAVYTWLGVTWLLTPTETRLAGIEWAGLTGDYIGAWWIAGGILSIIGALAVRNARRFSIAIFATIVTPMVVAALFFWSIFHGNPRGHITFGSYIPYSIIAAFIYWISARLQLASVREQQTDTNPLPVITREDHEHE